MKKYFYAIKMGNGVMDKIATSWEECEKYVIGFPAIYKKFEKEKDAKKYLKNFPQEEISWQLKWNTIHKLYRLQEQVERSCGIKIPTDMLEQLVQAEDYPAACGVINRAAKNGRIGKKDAQYLKKQIQRKWQKNSR